VFFDWDRTDLTARARQVVAEAAQAGTRVRPRALRSTATPTAPALRDTTKASQSAVRTPCGPNWCATGSPGDVISVQGYGEARLRVPMAQGAREPQNRRVEIMLR
jgi:hypothetical protein